MSFVAALAAVGSGLAAGAGALGTGLAAAGSGLAAGAGAIGSGLAGAAGAVGSGLGLGAGAAGAAGAGGAGLAGAAGAGGLGTLGAAGSSALSAGSLGLSSLGAGTTAAGLGSAAAPGLGAAMGAAGVGSALPMAASMGGAGLSAPLLGAAGTQALTGAGIGALGGAITNPDDPLRGALTGGISGGIGGYGAGALAGQAGAGGMLGQIGSFAAEHPNITSAGLGLVAQPLVSGLIPSSNEQSKIPGILSPEEEKKQWIAALNRYKPSLAPGYATGGITDLDGFQSNAQNMPRTGLNFSQPTTGTLSIPNPQEVADPEGYGSNSMALMAVGGIADLGGYAAGGRPNLLHGSGDGVSDDIPATIAGKQPARLAAGEYVVPSRIVSELGNGSTDAGAARLDDMVKRIQTGRRKTLHGKDYAKDTRAYKHLPA